MNYDYYFFYFRLPSQGFQEHRHFSHTGLNVQTENNKPHNVILSTDYMHTIIRYLKGNTIHFFETMLQVFLHPVIVI